MIEGLPLGGLGVLGVIALSGWSLVAYYMRGVMAGRLHPQATLDRMERDHQREVGDISHDRDEWRAESRIKDAQLALRDEQLRVVTIIGETTKATLDALNANLPGAKHQEST